MLSVIFNLFRKHGSSLSLSVGIFIVLTSFAFLI